MFDTEQFINEVSVRPPLWNLKLKEYNNRDLKSKLWIEIAMVMFPDSWEQLEVEEKNKGVKELQKKWKSLRDRFSRELKQLKQPSGSEQKKKKKYVFFDQLLFLSGINTDRVTVTNVMENTNEDAPNGDVLEEPVQTDQVSGPAQISNPTPAKKKFKQTPFETAILKHLANAEKPKDEEEEADKNFLLSFLPMMKKLPLDKKMLVRIKFSELMHQVLQTERNDSRSTILSHSSTQFPLENYYHNYSQQHSGPANNVTSVTDQAPRNSVDLLSVSPTPSENYSSNSEVYSVVFEL